MLHLIDIWYPVGSNLPTPKYKNPMNPSKKPSVGIVGAGTAGLATAIAFARLGHKVQVFEKHPSLAMLGAGLLIQPQGVAALTALGVGPDFQAVSLPIDRLLGKSHRDWTLVDIAYRSHEARSVSRSALAHLLLDAARSLGVGIRFSADVRRVETEGASGVACIDGERITFDLLVIADGAASILPAQAGLAVSSTQYKWGALWGMFDVDDWNGERTLEQRYQTTRKMFGLMPTARVEGKLRLSLFWSLPCDAYATWKTSSLEAWKTGLLELWPQAAPIVNQISSHEQLTFASYHHARPTRLANPPICILGDAAHAMSPQLGLGATLAVQDALALAELVEQHGAIQGPLLFSKKRLRTVRAYQALSRFLTPCFQADGGGLWRDLLFASGLYVPGVQQLMFRAVAEPMSAQRSYAGGYLGAEGPGVPR
jgi:2-polyprenyl-6-methoxyphenol hydroxylase-like FAD-dependent oxidoreductase